MNVKKTKEMVMDFRRNRPPPPPVSINGTDVETVQTSRYLDSTWRGSTNTEVV